MALLLQGDRILILYSLQNRLLDELHDNHPGFTHMKSLARSNVWWPSVDILIEQTVKSCNLY